MPAYLYSAPAGVEGDVTRPDKSIVEPAMLIPTGGGAYAQKFGIPVKYVAGGIQQFNGGAETPADLAGFLCRDIPAIGGNANSGFSNTIPNPDAVNSLLRSGYINVKCVSGTPARGGIVYARIVAGGGEAVGDLRTTDDGGDVIALSNCFWATDGKDADNNAEIEYNI